MTPPDHAYADSTSGGSGVSCRTAASRDMAAVGTVSTVDDFDLDVRIAPAVGTEDGLRTVLGEGAARLPRHASKRGRYECGSDSVVRAAPYSGVELPPWPGFEGPAPEDVTGWCVWIRRVWAVGTVAQCVRHASPGLADQVERLVAGGTSSVKLVRRTALSLLGYVLRLTTRPTPFGLFAGVAPGTFGSRAAVRWGSEHRAVARAGGVWLADVVARLERIAGVRELLPVVFNNTAEVRGEQLRVPFMVRPPSRTTTAIDEVSLRCTAPVREVMGLAQTPVPYRDLAEKLGPRFPDAGVDGVRGLLDRLVEARVLITGLQPPSTVVDALGHVLAQLRQARAADVPDAVGMVGVLREVHRLMGEHADQPVGDSAQVRGQVLTRMREVSPAADPLALDMRLDLEVTLPWAVAEEAASAASVLTRISPHPYGTPQWREYHRRFVARYGLNALVPVGDLLDPDIGLGVPRGYLGAAALTPGPVTARDRRLLTLAQLAAQEGREEIVLDEDLIGELTTGDPTVMRPPPHLDLIAAVHAESQQVLQQGDFTLVLSGLTRAQGTVSGGRFVPLLDTGWRTGVPAALSALPAGNPGAIPVQIAFPALDARAAHITRTPELLPQVISIGEHRAPCPGLIPPTDLAVAADLHGLYLMSLSTRTRLEPAVFHALQPEFHTPVLARFLAEVTRARTTAVTTADWRPPFDWGAAAHLPFLPRVAYRRTVLSPARWTLTTTDLPNSDTTPAEWAAALTALRERRRIPPTVLLTSWDQRLRLDLAHSAHRALLRSELGRAADGTVTLTEAPAPGAFGWCDGHPHEIVTLLRATNDTPRRVPRTPPNSVVRRDAGHLPGLSPHLAARLPLPVSSNDRHRLLAGHLCRLADALRPPGQNAPRWWYTTSAKHLHLTVQLPSAEFHGLRAHTISEWAKDLTEEGHLRGGDLELVAYQPHTGIWGDGEQLTAAEAVFAADTQAVLRQLNEPNPPDTRALTAAHYTAIAAGFLGSPERADQWFIDQPRPGRAAPPVPKHLRDQALQLADPVDGGKQLHSLPAVTSGWQARHDALGDYRTLLGPGMDESLIIHTLLHEHHNRAYGPDSDREALCRRLARDAALSRARRAPRTGGRARA